MIIMRFLKIATLRGAFQLVDIENGEVIAELNRRIIHCIAEAKNGHEL